MILNILCINYHIINDEIYRKIGEKRVFIIVASPKK